MQNKLFQVVLLIIALTGTAPSVLVAAENPAPADKGAPLTIKNMSASGLARTAVVMETRINSPTP